MASVEFKNVTKSYGNLVVVPNINLEIPYGKFTVLVGPSGCGKSTTLRMIAGLEEVTSGDLYIGDKRVNDMLPRDRDIAMVFQSYALYPHMTVYDNMAFGLKLRGMPKKEIEKRVSEASQMLGLDDFLLRKPKALSGGQRQRVAMGRAIVRRPKVFLFDEPLSNLDAKLRGDMRREIAKLHQTLKTTIVYVTHDQVEAMTLADQIVVMELGIIKQIGAPLTLYHKPENKFVAGFIGSPAMNFYSVEIKEKDGKLIISGENFEMDFPDRFKVEKGQKVDLGIRPEDIISFDENFENKNGVLECVVEVIEPLGSEIMVTSETAMGKNTTSFHPTFKTDIGEKIFVQFPPEKIHIFHEESGDSLTLEFLNSKKEEEEDEEIDKDKEALREPQGPGDEDKDKKDKKEKEKEKVKEKKEKKEKKKKVKIKVKKGKNKGEK
jgi:multiple sugar transport system ATP-binding protein